MDTILSREIVKDYNRSRRNTNKAILCHAPFTNINFDQFGNACACCYNKVDRLGKWPEQSIREIWDGARLTQLKDNILKNNLGGGCSTCARMISHGNYSGVRASGFDEYGNRSLERKVLDWLHKNPLQPLYPKVMEFELSNLCNLECIMCDGHFSSGIRKNREKLPPLISPYNEKFVKQLEEFIPHLTDAKFLGGEPFMIDIYMQIWELIASLNPKMSIHITTNGGFLNSRIKALLEKLNAGIVISIDSLRPDIYAKIRKNGDLKKVMENFEYFLKYDRSHKRDLSIAMCPMTLNWEELPDMLAFCIDKRIRLYLNTVTTPTELSLKHQSVGCLSEVIQYLSKYRIEKHSRNGLSPLSLSMKAYDDFIRQLKGWRNDKLEYEATVHSL